ncbi:MAG: hypothetical protein IPK83_11835 [Planctomycetes bacterium]|nr:hypothetical protein [Planctomycetota bacterium]
MVFDNGDRVLNPTNDRIFFTLSRNSPSINGFSAADILVSNGSGSFTRYAAAEDLGLAPSDAIDGLEIHVTDDIDQSIVNHALLLVIPGDHDNDGDLDQDDCEEFQNCYSGTAPLDTNGQANYTVGVGPANQFNPANLTIETGDRVTWVWSGGLHSVVSGTNGIYDGAFHSGVPTSVTGTTFQVVFSHAFVDLYPRSEGIYNYFSQTVPPPGMRGAVEVLPHPCATYDLDHDRDVDCEDWRILTTVYLEFNATLCVPLTIPEFVAVLLDQPMHPAHVCLADMNADGVANGRDVRPYVNAYLAMP